ncbi:MULTISPECIES: NUDIX domain-containing protein [unclassified Streptomyces]|nr:NUDIX domain-containing protein [Streptomyces sp. SID4937]
MAVETDLWDTYAASAFKEDAEPVFCWTQYAGHGPGPEVLGGPRSVLEVGCGTGRALAYLAQRGVVARGVDLSPVMVKQTTAKWAATGAEFICGEVLEHLRDHGETYDAVYSIFGAAWFTDPGRLFPLVHQRLYSRGVFAFSQPPAIPGAYGPQGMYKGGFAGRAMPSGRSQKPEPPPEGPAEVTSLRPGSLSESLLANARRGGIEKYVVGALITDEDGRVLLLRRRAEDFLGGLWELPSGGAKAGERLVDALCREVLEETGLTVSGVTGYVGSFDYASRSGRRTRQFTFAVNVTGGAAGAITLSEHDESAWVDPHDLPAVSDETRALLGG